jgi:Arc/MetJ-type ribon-helix-helix transcriptional regulator
MTEIKRRSRMISVRLSEEEYAALRHLCSLTGARSVSDLTRDAMRSVLKRSGREEPFGNNLEEFRVGMRNLEKKVEQLEAKIMLFKSEEIR